jgi:cell wall-associated NlpC family hydrolase
MTCSPAIPVDKDGAAAFAAAQAMVGVRFRPQGCDPATGLDCAGLLWVAYAAAGRRLVRPGDYPLRGWRRERVEAALAAAGFQPAIGRARVGDAVLIALAAGQFHLGLIGTTTFVHAHAGLRRVVETPLDAALLAAPRWRLVQEK